MTLQHIDQAADILVAFIFALAIGAAIVNWSAAQHHKRKAAKAQAEYWQKKNDQLKPRTIDLEAVGKAVNAEMQMRLGNDRS